MHAVVVRVKISDFEKAREGLRERVVPRATQANGFVAGYWTRSADGQDGLAMVVFDSESAAEAATEMIRAGAEQGDGVTLEGIEVREVVEHVSAEPPQIH